VVSCPQVSPPKPCMCYLHDHLNLLDLITCIIFGEEYRSLSSSLCSFLHSPITSILGPDILFNCSPCFLQNCFVYDVHILSFWWDQSAKMVWIRGCLWLQFIETAIKSSASPSIRILQTLQLDPEPVLSTSHHQNLFLVMFNSCTTCIMIVVFDQLYKFSIMKIFVSF
jgi:hypothetical protein